MENVGAPTFKVLLEGYNIGIVLVLFRRAIEDGEPQYNLFPGLSKHRA